MNWKNQDVSSKDWIKQFKYHEQETWKERLFNFTKFLLFMIFIALLSIER